MNAYKKGVVLLTFLSMAYGFIGALFYFNGLGELVGGAFFSEIKSIKGVGEEIPLALGTSLVFVWSLFGAIYIINKYSSTSNVENIGTENVYDLISATNEKGGIDKEIFPNRISKKMYTG